MYLVDTNVWLERLLEAESHDLTLVSFDHHFDRTSRGKKTPAQILESLASDDTPEEASPEESPPATEN